MRGSVIVVAPLLAPPSGYSHSSSMTPLKLMSRITRAYWKRSTIPIPTGVLRSDQPPPRANVVPASGRGTPLRSPAPRPPPRPPPPGPAAAAPPPPRPPAPRPPAPPAGGPAAPAGAPSRPPAAAAPPPRPPPAPRPPPRPSAGAAAAGPGYGPVSPPSPRFCSHASSFHAIPTTYRPAVRIS